jgi:2-polyprenyl-3-methyl-5-hydroxy-6-metoxy-1,4-benzoquinol methylase
LTDYYKVNRELWDKKTPVHKDSEFYDLEGFKRGNSSLNPIELSELKELQGKKVLHLQCHFGMDTLSLARLGADVTGVDFSSAAIDLARSLNQELDLNAKFICCNVFDLKDHLQEKFDIVYTSYGVIGWLESLGKWGELINYYLKPGGFFLMVEFHPVLWMFDEELKQQKYSYFNKEVIETVSSGTYADKDADIHMKEYGWNHPFTEVFNSLLTQRLALTAFEEYDYTYWELFPGMIKSEDGFYRIKGKEEMFPLMYKVKFVKGE